MCLPPCWLGFLLGSHADSSSQGEKNSQLEIKKKIIRVFRSSQTYLFPFHLSDEILAQPIFYGTVRMCKRHYLKLPNFSPCHATQICPVLLWFSVKKLVLEPLDAKRREEKRRRKREANKEKVAIARREAEASISLMEERFARIVGVCIIPKLKFLHSNNPDTISLIIPRPDFKMQVSPNNSSFLLSGFFRHISLPPKNNVNIIEMCILVGASVLRCKRRQLRHSFTSTRPGASDFCKTRTYVRKQ